MKTRLVWRDIKGLPHKIAKEEYRLNCLFCEDSGFHLYVNRFRKVYHCFKCGARGIVLDNSAYSTLDEFDVGKLHNLRAKPRIERDRVIKSLPRSKRLSYLTTSSKTRSKRYKNYLKSRGVTTKEVLDNKIRHSLDEEGIYKDSVVFPIYRNFELEYFVCRKLEGSPKYINAPWDKDDTLYTPVVQGESTPYVVICEGVFDALKIAKVARVHALLGKEANKAQIKRILHDEIHILICLDPDAHKYGLKLWAQIKGCSDRNIYGGVVKLQKDPGDTNPEVLERKLTDAYIQFCSGSSKRDRERRVGNGTQMSH